MEFAFSLLDLTITCANVLQDIQVSLHGYLRICRLKRNWSYLHKESVILFLGKRCEYLTSLSFVHNTSYIELEPLRTKPEANVTIIFATTQENGVLLYDGYQEHLAVELFNGRIRISYDVGNYPVSTMYRYPELNLFALSK